MVKKNDDESVMPTEAGRKMTQVLRELHGSKNPSAEQLHRFDKALLAVEQAYLAMDGFKPGGSVG